MRVGIATVQVPFVRGGAELLAESLQTALQNAGHEAEIISMPFKWYPPARVREHMLAARLMQVEESVGQRIDRLIGLKFPAYLMPHRSKRLWLLHQYRSAYDFWDAPFSDLRHAPDGPHVRSAIHTADNALLGECESLFTISRVVSDRLRRFNGLESEPLYHPPPGADLLQPGEYGEYILFPSRVNESKRQLLAIEALALTTQPVRLCFIGAGDAAEYERNLRARCRALGLDNRVEWRGAVSEADKLALYAGCLAVMFPPMDEDYGYVTLEAMLCAKAVLTTKDAGGPLDFIEDGHNGLICPPEPEFLAASLDRMWADRAKTAAWGRAGRQHYADLRLGWSHVLDRLLD
ncbi:glycosyltransferase family 4 protein [Acidisphaera sp. L21]|uniref:glycosyltransferase family 4 protein n=1 Tax=Acidisphaera sp. L21 TaxID=1641851 RepID=UPI00131DD3EE|nr:glycosyltransferase family 4 protein [Acidisphaera sp. L21]